MVMISNEI